jgi:hypothetical protein
MKKMCRSAQIVPIILVLLSLFIVISYEGALSKSAELTEFPERVQSVNEAQLDVAEAGESGASVENNMSVPALDKALRPYAVVVDANTLKDPQWGQVVEALKKKYNAKVFVAHYPEVGTIRKP